MSNSVDDLHITKVRPLITPAVLAEQLPATDQVLELVASARTDLESSLDGKSEKFIVVVGPCSIHDTEAALDYAAKLYALVPKLERLKIVMRVYFEKPRTVVGWKGLINDPDLDESYNINNGLFQARELLLSLSKIGLPCGTEFLDTTFGQYYADLISWGAIGARTAESQIHRELASGLSMPVGIKNRTDGDLKVAIDAIRSASHKHLFPSLTKEGSPAIFETGGNQYGHMILRGGDRSGPNYSAEHVSAAEKLHRDFDMVPRIMIDCSHGNSHKDPKKQIDVVDNVCEQKRAGNQSIKGVMLESFLLEGRQDYHPEANDYGKSITDACLSFADTVALLEKLNNSVTASSGES